MVTLGVLSRGVVGPKAEMLLGMKSRIGRSLVLSARHALKTELVKLMLIYDREFWEAPLPCARAHLERQVRVPLAGG